MKEQQSTWPYTEYVTAGDVQLNEADFRRMKACWSVCEGMPIGILEGADRRYFRNAMFGPLDRNLAVGWPWPAKTQAALKYWEAATIPNGERKFNLLTDEQLDHIARNDVPGDVSVKEGKRLYGRAVVRHVAQLIENDFLVFIGLVKSHPAQNVNTSFPVTDLSEQSRAFMVEHLRRMADAIEGGASVVRGGMAATSEYTLLADIAVLPVEQEKKAG